METAPSVTARSFLSLALALVPVLFVCGCIIIPIPESDSGDTRANLNEQSPERIHPGVTTLEDVLLTFGEPDAVSPDEHKLAYRSEKLTGVWAAGSMYASISGTFTREYYLTVELDERGIVQNRELFSREFLPNAPEAVLDAMGPTNAAAAAMDKGAIVSARAIWLPNTEDSKTLVRGSGQRLPGYLALTPDAIRFRDGSQLGNTEPRWLLPYQTLVECRLAPFAFGLAYKHGIVIRTRDNQVHSFLLLKPDGSISDNKKTEAAFQFLQNRIDTRNRPVSPRPSP